MFSANVQVPTFVESIDNHAASLIALQDKNINFCLLAKSRDVFCWVKTSLLNPQVALRLGWSSLAHWMI